VTADHPGNCTGWSWALPGVSETAALHVEKKINFELQSKDL
jgi:hypothetical protein